MAGLLDVIFVANVTTEGARGDTNCVVTIEEAVEVPDDRIVDKGGGAGATKARDDVASVLVPVIRKITS